MLIALSQKAVVSLEGPYTTRMLIVLRLGNVRLKESVLFPSFEMEIMMEELQFFEENEYFEHYASLDC